MTDNSPQSHGPVPYLELSQSQGGLVTVEVRQSRRHHQDALVERSLQALRGATERGLVTAAAVLRGSRGKDVAVLTRPATPEPGAGPAVIPDNTLHTVETVDHITGRGFSVIERDSELFHFVNVFKVAPGKRNRMIEYFGHTIPYVRQQPGYVATNLLVSLDGRQAINVGQYESRADFLAIFRQPEVIGAFARGFPKRIMRPIFGWIPEPPRLRLYDLVDVMAAQKQPS